MTTIMMTLTMIMTTFYFRCQVCREKLDGSCFTKFGQFYCKQDFYRLFGPRCSVCQQV